MVVLVLVVVVVAGVVVVVVVVVAGVVVVVVEVVVVVVVVVVDTILVGGLMLNPYVVTEVSPAMLGNPMVTDPGIVNVCSILVIFITSLIDPQIPAVGQSVKLIDTDPVVDIK